MTITMNAIRIHQYGGPEVLVEEKTARPKPGYGEVLIRVRAAGVNPLDWKVRAGYVKDWLNHKLPLIPGWDVSGLVDTVGPGVRKYEAGDSIFGLLDTTRNGSYAEYVIARENDMAPMPSTCDHVHAAALPIAALTAWQALIDIANVRSGQTVLIHAAAGGVGHIAVQLAKWKGAKVIGTASSRNIDFIRELGADDAINYEMTPFENRARDVDIILDLVGGETQQRSWQVLKKGGMLISTVGITSPDAPERYGVRAEAVFVRPDATELNQIAKLVDTHILKPVVNRVFSLSDAAKAHTLSQQGHVRGKIVLSIGI